MEFAVVVVGISLMTSDAEHIFLHILGMGLFFVKSSPCLSFPFKLDYLSLVFTSLICVLEDRPFIYMIYINTHMHTHMCACTNICYIHTPHTDNHEG